MGDTTILRWRNFGARYGNPVAGKEANVWREHWQNTDPEIAEAILAQLLRLTRASELYWTAVGTKFRTAVTGKWSFALNVREYDELPTLVAYGGGSAVVLVSDRQKSHDPFSALMMSLLGYLERQLPEREAARLHGEDGKSAEERFEQSITERLKCTKGETTIEAFTGVILRELRGWR